MGRTNPTADDAHRVDTFDSEIAMHGGLMDRDQPSVSLEALLNTTQALIFALTPQGQLIKFNRACEVLTGYFFEEVYNKFYWDLFLSAEEAVVAKTAFGAANVGYFLNQHEGRWLTKTQRYRF